MMSPGSTGAPVEVAFKPGLSFSLSEAITDTRPLRFLIVKSVFALVFSSRSYVCARIRLVEQSKTAAKMKSRTDLLRKDKWVLQNMAIDLACARDSWSS